jgi:hypothetical protein
LTETVSCLTVPLQLLFCFHFSIVKVLTSPSGARIANDLKQVVRSFAVAQVVCHISSILSRGLLISFSPVKKLVFISCPLSFTSEESAQPTTRSDIALCIHANGRNKPLLVVMLQEMESLRGATLTWPISTELHDRQAHPINRNQVIDFS